MKKYLFIAAMLLTSGLIFAFQSDGKKNAPVETVAQQWYTFNGGNPALPSNYTLRSTPEVPDCPGGEFMCAVKAVPHPTLTGKPDLADPAIIELQEN